MDVANAGVVWNDHRPAFLPLLIYMDVGNAGVAGALTCRHRKRCPAHTVGIRMGVQRSEAGLRLSHRFTHGGRRVNGAW